ncbi:Pisatin demethylase [Colletotrichum sp. SAR 10_98]|nr:Pisatin demethylase [Colletotrichum sp. SAR 10_98]
MRRQVSNVYTMSNMVSYEPYIDECTNILSQRFSEFSAENQTFSERFGCLDAGEDHGGIIKALDDSATISVGVGVYSWVSRYMFMLFQYLGKGEGKELKGNAFVVNYMEEQLAAARARGEKEKALGGFDGPQDFISKLLQTQRERAGSDTTAITLSGIVYYLCRSPRAMQKLRKELEDAEAEGSVSSPITFREAQALPYLQAVIKESLWLHPATGYTMPHIMPEGGRQLAGYFFPEGIDLTPEQKSAMESYFFAFGQGSRTCIGKNISLLEVSKAIPRMIQNFNFIIENDDEWECTTHWFVKPQNFRCLVKKRGSC